MIRPANPSDVSTILAFINELAEYAHLEHACAATEELLRENLFGAEPAAEAAMLEWEGKAVGYAIWFKTFSSFLARPGVYLEDIYVQPAFRGRGLGKSVFAHLVKIAAARGYGRIEWSVLKWNTPSIEFYQSLGAAALDGWEVMRLDAFAIAALAKRWG